MKSSGGYLPLLLSFAGIVQGQVLQAAPIALIHVTVIDMTGAAPKPDMTLVIQGARIGVLGRSSHTRAPKGAQVIDARGQYLIPGLWDMHTHNFFGPNQSFYSLYIANGVTGVRDMGGVWKYFDAYETARHAGQSLNGKWPAPRIVAAGVILDGKPPVHPTNVGVTNAQEARQAVETNRQRGADFIKVYSMLDRAAYFAIADEAKQDGLPFAGHVPLAVSAAEASDAGQKSIEHSYGILLGSSTRESGIRARKLEELGKRDSNLRALLKSEYEPIDSYSQGKADALFALFVKNGTWVCPTLVVQNRLLVNGKSAAVEQLSSRYVPHLAQGFWREAEQSMAKSLTPEDRAGDQKLYPKYLDLVQAMHRAGVPLLAGTDTPNPWVVPGFSLHEELALLVKAGLTPLQALQTATINPARFLGEERQLGTIEVGKLADVVLLDADPLADIHNTASIAAVFADGRYLSKRALQQMLGEVETSAKAPH
ncbi:MAG: amidohydrolase family protein [Steroidobacteraceae bacterium]